MNEQRHRMGEEVGGHGGQTESTQRRRQCASRLQDGVSGRGLSAQPAWLLGDLCLNETKQLRRGTGLPG